MASEEEIAKTISSAQDAIKEAVSKKLGEEGPNIVRNAEQMLDECDAITLALESVYSEIGNIFPNESLTPWREVGSHAYFIKKKALFEAMVNATVLSAKSKTTGNFVPARSEERPANGAYKWETYAPPSMLKLLRQEVLENEKVRDYLKKAKSSDESTFIHGGTARWSWVSELGTNIPSCPPDFPYTEDADGTISVPSSYPFGWLTTLETALATLAYFSYATNGDSQDYERSSDNEPYMLFDRAAINNFKRPGDIDFGINTIFDGNHSNRRSFGPIQTGYNIGPLRWDNVARDPSSLLSIIFNKDVEACKEITKRLYVDTQIVSTGNFINRNAEEGAGSVVYSRSLSDFRPFSLLQGGGVLQQGAYSDGTIAADNDVLKGYSFEKSSLENNPANYSGLAKKLTLDANLLQRLNSNIQSGVEIQSLGLSQSLTQADLDDLSQNNTLSKLATLMKNVAGLLNTHCQRMWEYSNAIVLSHVEVIQEYCQALEDIEEAFDEGDWKPGDNWDDDLLPQIAAGANALDNLTDTFIASGQTSVMFKEQCFLLSFINPIAKAKAQKLDTVKLNDYNSNNYKVSKRLPYVSSEYNTKPMEQNASLLLDGEGYGFLNTLVSNPNLAPYQEILNHELSNLQPKIRLWKVIFDDDGNERDVEIKFDSHFAASDLQLFKSTSARGVGVGLKSFNFTYDGNNPFAVKKSIKANLKIFANSFSELLRDRTGYYKDDQGRLQKEKYKITDLAMKTANTRDPVAPETQVSCADQLDLHAENTALAELNFRLKAQIGMSAPVNSMSSMRADLRKALSETHVTINLTPTVHNFEFDDQGRVMFNLNFLAYIEQMFDQAAYNIFSDHNIMANRYYRELIMKYHNSSDCDAEQINQKKQDFAEAIKAEQERGIASLIGALMEEELIYYMPIPYSIIKTFVSNGPYATYNQIDAEKNIKLLSNKSHDAHLKQRIDTALNNEFRADRGQGATGISSENKPQIQAALLGNDPRETDLSFFFLSDLIDLILIKIEKGLNDTINNPSKITSAHPDGSLISNVEVDRKIATLRKSLSAMKKLRILLGPMELTHPKANEGMQSSYVNLGDCPISVKYFVEWLANKMLSKDEVSYPLTRFLNDIMNDLVKNFLNNDQCFGYSIKQKTVLNQATITSFGQLQYDPITFQIVKQIEDSVANSDDGTRIKMRYDARNWDPSQLPVLNPSGPSNSARTDVPSGNEYNFFVFFAGRTMPVEEQNGNKTADEARGIFHYILGKDRGLVKNIKLTKTQTKGLAEVRFEQDGYEGLEQLRVVYDAQVDMYANVQAFPGTYIYIDPKGFAPEGSGDDQFKLTDLGVGGYYMIIRSEHEFAEGKANTILHTKWVQGIDRDDPCFVRPTTMGSAEPQSRKCSIQLRSNEPPEIETPSLWSTLFG